MIIKPQKWMQLLAHVEDNNLSRLSFKLDCTYSHLTKLVKEFDEKGWITREKVGRTIANRLTDKGKKVQNDTIKILNEIGGLSYVK
mgnify:CR=1 FL=1